MLIDLVARISRTSQDYDDNMMSFTEFLKHVTVPPSAGSATRSGENPGLEGMDLRSVFMMLH